MSTYKIKLPDGKFCHTGPTCQLHEGKHDPVSKLNALLDTNTIAEPKEGDVKEFFGDGVVPEKKVKAPRLSKADWIAAQVDKLKGFHDELEVAVTNLKDDTNWRTYLDSMSKLHTYSYGNQLLIKMQAPHATVVAGFNKWEELERNVIKGETCKIRVLAPQFSNKIVKDAAGKPIIGADGKPVKDRTVIGFKAVPVYDISQTEGKDLPSMPKLSETPPPGFQTDLETAVQSYGYTVEYSENSGQGEGYTSKQTMKVVVKSSLNEGQKASVLAHELGHIAAGHMERTGEYHTGAGGARSAMEVEAESISYVLCRSNGMTPQVGTESKVYVAGWSRAGGDPDAVKKSAEVVANTVKALLTKNKWVNALSF